MGNGSSISSTQPQVTANAQNGANNNNLRNSPPRLSTAHQQQVIVATQPAADDAASAGYYKVILSGILKNVPGSHLRSHIPKMVELGRQLAGNDDDFHILIYENDSKPDTRNTLKELLEGKPYVTYFYEDGASFGGSRTDKIAGARNRMMKILETKVLPKGSYEYLFVMDMDGVCGGGDTTKSYDPEIFRYALQHSDEWDGVSFRYVPYWDLWALRHEEWMPVNHFGGDKSRNKVRSYKTMDEILNNLPRKDFITVQSAFMMLAIYKIPMVTGMRYSGKGVNGEVDCENVSFHKALIEQRNARLRLLPMVFCVGDPGYFPLSEQLTM